MKKTIAHKKLNVQHRNSFESLDYMFRFTFLENQLCINHLYTEKNGTGAT